MDRPLRLPDGLVLARTTDVFDETSHPAGLRRAHRIADGVWGRLVVHSGALRFTFDDEPDAPVTVAAAGDIVIPPARLHHIDIDASVTFVIEFHRRPEAGDVRPGSESSGISEGDLPQ